MNERSAQLGDRPAQLTTRSGTRDRGSRRSSISRWLLLAALALVALMLLGNLPGAFGTAIAVVTPWLGFAVLLLALAALLTRPRTIWLAALPALVWATTVWGFLGERKRNKQIIPVRKQENQRTEPPQHHDGRRQVARQHE